MLNNGQCIQNHKDNGTCLRLQGQCANVCTCYQETETTETNSEEVLQDL